MQGTTSFNDPLLPTAQEYSEYNRDDENLPEASTTDPSRILESDEYEVYKNVPVFVEHTRTLKSGRELRFGRDELEALAQRSNRRIEETGDFAPVVIGHTNPDPAAPDPPKIGWAGPFRLGWLTKDHTKYAVLADFRIEKDKTKMLNKYPRRSAELWAEDRYEDMYLDPISLLGADTPWSDMGVLYCKQGDEHREKIYYSITPQVPGAYGFPKPVVIKNSSSSDSKDGKKEKYSMENEDYGRDPQNLSQDQKDVANTIVSAIFDSPEFKYLRKLMNQEADRIEEENDENAAKEQNNGGSTLGNDDSEKISEKIEENSNSEGNTEGESNEYTDENNDVQNNEEASSSENDDETTSESESSDDEEEKLDLNDKPEEDDGHDPYEAYYKRSGRQDNSMADEEEKKEETTTTDDADAEETTSSDESDDVDVDSMSDEEFENYLRKKYGVHDDEEESDDEENDDDSDDDEDDDEDEDEHANYAKEDDGETDDNDETDNKFMSMSLDEIQSYLETKYGGELPKPGDPQFAKLSTDLAYLAYLIKTQEEPQVQEENIDDASSPQRYSRGANPDAQYAKEEDMTTREYCDRKDRESDDFDPQQLIETNAAESKARKALDSASDEDRPALKEELDKIQQYQKELRLKKKARDERFAEQYSRNGVGVAVNVLDPSYDGSLIWTLEATIGELEQLKEYVENKQWREAAKAKLGHALSQEEESAAWIERLNDLAKQGVWWATNPKLEYDPNEEDEFDDIDGEEDETEPAVAYEGEAEDAVEYQAKDKKDDAKKDDDSEESDAEKLEASLADSDVEDDDDSLIDADEEDVEPDDSLVDPDDDLEDDDDEEEEEEDEPAEYARKKKTTTSGSALKGFLDDSDDDEEESEDGDATEVEQNCKDASETSVPYNGESVAIVESDGDVRSRDDLLNEIEQLKNRIASLEKAFDWTTEKVVSAERYSRLHDLRENFVFDENVERENCRYCKMSDEQFEKRCEEIQSNYRRVPTGIEVPFGLVSAAPADAERPGSVQYAKETSADFEKQVVELAESYAARGIYKPSDEIRAEVAANNKQ